MDLLCSNPDCSARRRCIGEGHIFFFPSDTDSESLAMPAIDVEHWLCQWLCNDCMKAMTIMMTPAGPRIQTLALPHQAVAEKNIAEFPTRLKTTNIPLLKAG
jgi:hypothetical protein